VFIPFGSMTVWFVQPFLLALYRGTRGSFQTPKQDQHANRYGLLQERPSLRNINQQIK